MRTNIHLKELKKYLNNKSIAIIGSGTCIENGEWGNEIDSHDVVIRINNSFRNTTWLNKDKQIHVGSRTDIYVANGDTNNKRKWAIRAQNKYKVKYILRLNPGGAMTSLQSQLIKEVSNVYLAWDFRDKLQELYSEFGGSRPATGSMLIKWLVSNIKYNSISMYGFDFFNEFKDISNWGPGGTKNPRIKYGKQDRFWNDYQCSWRGCHNPAAEEKWFKKYINKYNIKHNI